MMRRPTRPRAYAPDPAAPPGRPCDMPDCHELGEYRAPKSRATLNDYYWFCLEHVRAYNAGWDFYKGMSPAEVEAQLRADTSWQRPTWPIGSLGHAAWDEDALNDPLHILAAGRMKTDQRTRPAQTTRGTPRAAGDFRPVVANHLGRGQNPLQGIGKTAPSRRQRR